MVDHVVIERGGSVWRSPGELADCGEEARLPGQPPGGSVIRMPILRVGREHDAGAKASNQLDHDLAVLGLRSDPPVRKLETDPLVDAQDGGGALRLPAPLLWGSMGCQFASGEIGNSDPKAAEDDQGEDTTTPHLRIVGVGTNREQVHGLGHAARYS
jgi:hypothetical protein